MSFQMRGDVAGEQGAAITITEGRGRDGVVGRNQQNLRRRQAENRVLIAPSLPKKTPNSNNLNSFGGKLPGLKVLLLNDRPVKGKTTNTQDLNSG